ncbi:hypothetical protein D3C80_1214740 [compost metagenome]
MATAAAGQGLQARHQFEKGKRLAKVVVGTFAQAMDAVFDPLAGSQHDHRCLLARTQAAQDAVAVQARKHHIEHDHRVITFQRQVQAFDAVGRHVHGEALFRQAAVQVISGFFFIFNNQDTHDRLSIGVWQRRAWQRLAPVKQTLECQVYDRSSEQRQRLAHQ